MENQGEKFQNYEAVKNRINSTQSRIRWIDDQLTSLKGPLNFLRRRKLKKSKSDDIEKLNEMQNKTPVMGVDEALKEAQESLSKS